MMIMVMDSYTLYTTIAIFGVISFAIYVVVLRPLHQYNNNNNNNNNPRGRQRQNPSSLSSSTGFVSQQQQQQTGPGRASNKRGGLGSYGTDGGETTVRHVNVPVHLDPSSVPYLLQQPSTAIAPTSAFMSSSTTTTTSATAVHSSSPMSNNNGTRNLVVDGILAFKHCRASHYEQQQQQHQHHSSEQHTNNLRERARLFTRFIEIANASLRQQYNSTNLSSSTNSGASNTPTPLSDRSLSSNGTASSSMLLSSPPKRGSTVVVSIPVDDVGCPRLRRILFLLGTYCNLLVILAAEPTATGTKFTNQDRCRAIQALRGNKDAATNDESSSNNKVNQGNSSLFVMSANYLSPEVLPDHRIVASTTAAGRIAFVRQLQRTEWIIDFDVQVEQALRRFGYTVLLIPNKNHNSNNAGNANAVPSTTPPTSRLAAALLAEQ